MNKQFSILLLSICLFAVSSYAQIDPASLGYYTDALKFSQSSPGGTARFQGMGGVNNALGADLSSLSGNPAGMGFYQKSEIGISSALGFGNTNSTFLSNTQKDNRIYLYFPNFGMAFTAKKDITKEGAYRGGSFGVGFTRIHNFQNQFTFSDSNHTSGIASYIADIASGIPSSELDAEIDNISSIEGLAYHTYFIDPNPDFSDTYVPHYGGTTPFKQEEKVLTRGAINQWNFSYGGNFNDKLYIGASLGVPVLRYLVNSTYKETYQKNDSIDFLRFSESLKLKGTGFNLKLGAILKPKDWIRIGVSIQTPTYYFINQTQQYSAKSAYKGDLANDSYDKKTVINEYKYNLITPFKASAGIALFAGKSGFIAADVEYVPYSMASLQENSIYSSIDNSTFDADNNTIQNLYKPALNFSVGGEYRYQIYRFRAGYSLRGDAYNDYDDVDRKVSSISGGAGVRLDNYYFDIALVNSKYNSVYRSFNGAPEARTKNGNTSFVMSAGLFF